MADIELSQREADKLMQMAKIRATNDNYTYPGLGGSLTVPLTSEDGRENFLVANIV